jgi:hypothetical protein
MKTLLAILFFAVSLCFADSDSTSDTTIMAISWKNQPSQFIVAKNGDMTALLPPQIMAILPLDSLHGIRFNTQGAMNIWSDSLQLLDTIVFSSKKQPADTVFAYYQNEFKKYLKHLAKTKQQQ